MKPGMANSQSPKTNLRCYFLEKKPLILWVKNGQFYVFYNFTKYWLVNHAGVGTAFSRVCPFVCALKPSPHQQQCRSNVRHCCQKRQQCRTSFALKFRPFDKVERCFDIFAQNGNIVEATENKVSCCFDNVASTLLLVWTGLNRKTAWAINTKLGTRIQVYSIVVAWHAMTQRSKGKKSRSHGYENRHGRTVASDPAGVRYTYTPLCHLRPLLAWVCMTIGLPMVSSFKTAFAANSAVNASAHSSLKI